MQDGQAPLVLVHQGERGALHGLVLGDAQRVDQRACQQGLGIAALPDYLVEDNNRLVQLFSEADSIQLDTYFVYPEELKSVARVQVFRDFIVSKAQRWPS